MTMDEILEQVIVLAENDQSISDTNVIAWVNMAINRINQAMKGNIPTVTDIGTISPSFDERFHEALVLFCVAKYREGDSAYSDAQYFMQQFNDMVLVMQRDMELKPSTRMDYNVQQIVVPDGNTYTYNLTMQNGSYYDKIVVYLNDSEVDSKYYSINSVSRTITFKGITLAMNDKLTIQFENNSDLNEPPYQWWGTSGW